MAGRGEPQPSHAPGARPCTAASRLLAAVQALGEARAETDQAKRAELYEKASHIVVDDAADIWIYNTVQLRGLNDRVKGYKFSPVGSGGDIRWISVD